MTYLKLLLALSAGCSSAFAPSSGMAESFPLSDVIPREYPLEQRMMLQTHAQKLADGIYNHLVLRVDEIDRICDLSEPQHHQFSIAAKGVAQHRVDEFVIQLVSRYERGPEKPQNVDVVRPRLGLVVANRGDAGIVVEHVPQREDTPFEGTPGLLTKSEQQRWQGTIIRTLSDDQFENYEQAQRVRSAQPKEWRHERVMIEFDRMLRLDSSQREPIAERVGKFLEMSQIKRWLKRKQGFDDAALARMAMRAIPSEDVKNILSTRQMSQWQYLLREDLESR